MCPELEIQVFTWGIKVSKDEDRNWNDSCLLLESKPNEKGLENKKSYLILS